MNRVVSLSGQQYWWVNVWGSSRFRILSAQRRSACWTDTRTRSFQASKNKYAPTYQIRLHVIMRLTTPSSAQSSWIRSCLGNRARAIVCREKWNSKYSICGGSLGCELGSSIKRMGVGWNLIPRQRNRLITSLHPRFIIAITWFVMHWSSSSQIG